MMKWYVTILAFVCSAASASAQQTYTVDKAHPACADVAGAGTVERPYCTFRYVTTIAKPGDTFLIQAGRYGEGPVELRRTGTATAPITYRAVGDVVIGLFTDLVDEDFQASQWPVASFPNIYSLRVAVKPARVYQDRFDPIVIDDPDNPSYFVMKEADGPMALSAAVDYVTLSAQEGTFLWDAGRLHVHPYGHRKPGTDTTGFVTATGNALTVHASVSYNVFEGLRIPYAGSPQTLVFGSNNRFVNVTFQATGLSLRGNNNVVDGLTISHVLSRDEEWTWHFRAGGTAMAVYGKGHVLKNLHLFHNWNSSIAAENASGLVIDGLRMHGAPNHCGASSPGALIKNAIFWNCQDFLYLMNEPAGVVYDHIVAPYGIAFQGLNRASQPATIKNSIFSGTVGWTSLSQIVNCTWESGSVMERNVIDAGAVIFHCADKKRYPILQYQALCAAKTLTGCMTIKDNILVTDWNTVMVEGLWPRQTDAWDVTLVLGSPAIGAATDGLDIGPTK